MDSQSKLSPNCSSMKVDRPFPRAYLLTVIDTNVLISASLVRPSVPATCVDSVLTSGRLVFTETTLSEFESRIWKPKFDKYLSIEHRRKIINDAGAAALIVAVPEELSQKKYSTDPDDDAFIHAAIAAGSERLISGDPHLLSVRSVGPLRIVTPREAFEEILGETSHSYPLNP